MSLHWAGNLVGAPVCEEHMRDIPRPKTELLIHVTARTVQSGALLGTAFAAPIAMLAQGRNRSLFCCAGVIISYSVSRTESFKHVARLHMCP